MKKNFYTLGLILLLSASLLPGCSKQDAVPPNVTDAAQKPVINFQGIVTSVDDEIITLDNGKVILITDKTKFATDPDSNHAVSEDIVPGNYIQGYTADDTDAMELTASRIWSNTAPSGGKMVVNFEGRVITVNNGEVSLENGKTIHINDSTIITDFQGKTANISAGDYIQGYAENPEESEIDALYILITIL